MSPSLVIALALLLVMPAAARGRPILAQPLLVAPEELTVAVLRYAFTERHAPSLEAIQRRGRVAIREHESMPIERAMRKLHLGKWVVDESGEWGRRRRGTRATWYQVRVRSIEGGKARVGISHDEEWTPSRAPFVIDSGSAGCEETVLFELRDRRWRFAERGATLCWD